MEVIAILVLTVWSVVVAWNEAAEDARAIKRNDPIDHAKELREWIRMVLPVTMLIAFAVCWIRWELWPALPLMAISWASFTAPFRFVLNWKRDPRMDWRYVSPGSWYDWQFMRIIGYHWREADIADHDKKYNGIGKYSMVQHEYRRNIHRAGAMAYILETTVLALAIAVLMLTKSN